VRRLSARADPHFQGAHDLSPRRRGTGRCTLETADRPRGQRGGRSGVRCSQADGLRPAPVAPQSLVSSQPSGTSKRQLTRASPRVLAGRAVGSREQGARAYAGPISSPPWRPRRRSFEALEHHRSGRRDGPQGVDNYHHPGTQGGDGRGHVTTPTKARPPGVTTLFPGASQGCRLNRRVWGQFFGSRRFNRRVTRGFGPPRVGIVRFVSHLVTSHFGCCGGALCRRPGASLH
jgi:hypothetical protein